VLPVDRDAALDGDAEDVSVALDEAELDGEDVDDGEPFAEATGVALSRADRLWDDEPTGERLSTTLDVELGVSAVDGDAAKLDAKGDGVGVGCADSDRLSELEAVEDDDRVSVAEPLIDADVSAERDGERVAFTERVIDGDSLA
jgi:hypothetical protein